MLSVSDNTLVCIRQRDIQLIWIIYLSNVASLSFMLDSPLASARGGGSASACQGSRCEGGAGDLRTCGQGKARFAGTAAQLRRNAP